MPTESRQVSPIERDCHDLTALARQDRLQHLHGCERHISRIFDILLRSHRLGHASACNPASVGTDDDEGWPLVAEVARRIAAGRAREMLRDLRVVAPDWEALISGLSVSVIHSQQFPARKPDVYPLEKEDVDRHFREHFDRIQATPIFQRLKALFASPRDTNRQAVLYVPDLHRLVAGEPERYPIDAYDLLKPALGRGEIQFIGTCSLLDNYRKYTQRDASLQRRFQEVCTPQLVERNRLDTRAAACAGLTYGTSNSTEGKT
jgi:ATP-dependent Clp protease ATP-binding subunit ClpB